MIIESVDKQLIDKVANVMRAHNESPILYINQENAGELCSMVIELPTTATTEAVLPNFKGYAGKYLGIPVYITEDVGKYIVMVPQWQEKEINE